MKNFSKLIAIVFLLYLVACTSDEPAVLRLATTTSTDNSGLLELILPEFEKQYKARIAVLAVGTGQAIALGRAGDVDVILVHARSLEDAFIEAGHGTQRFVVMYNDFVIVGPKEDIADIRGMQFAKDAFVAIAHSEAIFAARGDDSGTHMKERILWDLSGIDPDMLSERYKSIGQGMAETLRFADELGAYTLTDRGTYLALQEKFSNLEVLVGGDNISENEDPALINSYSLIPVNPDKGNINFELTQKFARWIISIETQIAIANHGIQEFGQPLFYPDSDPWNNR